jgi:hypothetical protein
MTHLDAKLRSVDFAPAVKLCQNAPQRLGPRRQGIDLRFVGARLFAVLDEPCFGQLAQALRQHLVAQVRHELAQLREPKRTKLEVAQDHCFSTEYLQREFGGSLLAIPSRSLRRALLSRHNDIEQTEAD